MTYHTVAEAAAMLAEKNCPSGERLRAEIGESGAYHTLITAKGTEKKRLKLYSRELDALTKALDAEECITTKPYQADTKRVGKLREGVLQTMTQEFQARLIEAVKSGRLTVRDRITKLSCALKSPETEMLVSQDDL